MLIFHAPYPSIYRFCEPVLLQELASLARISRGIQTYRRQVIRDHDIVAITVECNISKDFQLLFVI